MDGSATTHDATKILVVEDDPVSRRVLAHIVKQEIGCEVLEAANGIEGLCAIERHSPTLVLLDTVMPVMDGITMLAAVRSSPRHASLPVISVSSVKDRSMVLRLVSLGIIDYIVKPVDRGDVGPRIRAALEALEKDSEPETDGAAVGSRRDSKLLVVDKDPGFRRFAQDALGDRFQVVRTCATGADALELITQHRPDLVLLGEGLELLTESMLAAAIPALVEDAPPVYLLSDRPEAVPDAERGRYRGIIVKSPDPQALLGSVEQCLEHRDVHTTLTALLDKRLRSEIVACTSHAIGLLTNQPVTPLGVDAIGTISREVDGKVELKADQGGAVEVHLYGAQEDMIRLSRLALGRDFDFDESAWDVLGQCLETLGERISATVRQEGLRFDASAPIVRLPTDDPSVPSHAIAVPFHCRSGQRFVVVVLIHEPPQPESAETDQGSALAS